MKIKFYLSLIVLISSLYSFGQTTNQSGNWESNIWSGKKPGLTLTKSVTVESGHNVYIGEAGDNKILNLKGKKGGTLLIKGVLTINGSLTVTGKRWNIEVADGGVLVITKDVNFSQQQGGGPNMPNLNISGNGSVTVNGNINSTGHGGNIIGNGVINVDGEITGNVIINPDVTVIGHPDTYCPPLNLTGSIAFDGQSYEVTLEWFINEGCTPVNFRIIRILNENVDTFYVDVMKSTLHYWIDNNELEGSSEPAYEVSALYLSGNDSILSIPAVLSYENSPLPIDLLNFSAKLLNGEIELGWATAAEINNDYFTIERSNDGNKWEVIGYVQGAGNSNHVIHYDYTDQNPLEGVNYYRLKQTDFDGKYEYFSPVAVHFTNNDANGKIVNTMARAQQLDVYLHNQDASAILLVTDMSGRVIYRQYAPVADYIQQISIPLTRNYSGEILIIKLVSSIKSDVTKLMVR